MSVVALENFGNPRELHIEPIALSAFVRQFYPHFRSAPGLSNQTVGYDVSKVTTTAGSIDMKPNLFLRPRGRARREGVPGAPTLGSFAFTGAAHTLPGKLEDGKVYRYKITCVNDKGESAPKDITAPVTADANGSAILTLSNVPAGTKAFRVYRTEAGGAAGTEKFIGNYANVGSTLVDIGAKAPGLGEAFLLDMSAEVMRFKQLAPLSKINFAIVTTALEFAIVLYGALFVYAPRFNVFFENVGK